MIAVDAMGGDNAPVVVVQGALHSARTGVPIVLFGEQSVLLPLLDRTEEGWRALPISIQHCPDVVTMDDEPTRAVMQKKHASLVKAVQSVGLSATQAVVSAGNSGAMLVASTLLIGRTPGIMRPAIGTFLPSYNGSLFCLDLGATTDCKVDYLVQFAAMGRTYLEEVLNIDNPRIGLLSNGHEPYKGSTLIKDAYQALKASERNFVGNIEARDIFADKTDILVCDGFTGNVMLKTAQATVKAIMHWLHQEAHSSLLSKLSLALSRPVFKKLYNKINYERAGGGILLGVRSPVIVAHGSSQAYSISQAITQAYRMVQNKGMEKFNKKITAVV
jgi:phosphate acyltransferase